MPKLTQTQGVILLLIVAGTILLLVYLYKNSWSEGRHQLPRLPRLPRMPHLPHLPTQSQLNQWKAKHCPTCQSEGPCMCPPQRPTMEDVQNACEGQDPSQGVPFTVDCVNKTYEVYGCNPRYPDPNTTPQDINFNDTSAYAYKWSDINGDAYQWSTLTDDGHRQGCYAPGGVPM